MLALSDNLSVRWSSTATAGLGEMSGRWRVAHTRARCEKAFAFDLMDEGIGFFLPMADRVGFPGGGQRQAMLPLFPGYVFFCGGEQDRYRALATGRLCQVIEVADQARLVRELTSLDSAIANNVRLDPYPVAVIGPRCRVRSGPFEGIEGVMIRPDEIRPDETTRLVLEVSILGQAVVFETDADLLEPCDAAGSEGAVRSEPRVHLPRGASRHASKTGLEILGRTNGVS